MFHPPIDDHKHRQHQTGHSSTQAELSPSHNTEQTALRDLRPVHAKARERLYFQDPLSTPNITSDDLLRAINQSNSRNPIGRFTNYVKGKLFPHNLHASDSEKSAKEEVKNYILEEMSRLLQNTKLRSIYPDHLKESILNKLNAHNESIQSFSKQHPQKVNRYINDATQAAIRIKHENREHQIKAEIKNLATEIQHQAFLDDKEVNLNIPSTPDSPPTEQPTLQQLFPEIKAVNFDYKLPPSKFANKVKQDILSTKKMSRSQSRNIFRSLKDKDAFRRAPFTQIRTESGDIYELMNTLDEQHNKDDIESLRQLHDILPSKSNSTHHKYILGSGGFGSVRLARNVETGEIVAVKKTKSVDKKILESTTNEVALLKNKFKNEFNNNDYFITFRDFAVSDKKSYLFMSFGGSQNGAKTIKALHEQKMINGKAQHEQQVKAIAKRYTQCVSELHKKGIHHRDIKPDNFFHGKNGIKLGDFGTAIETEKEKIKGTENFFPGTLDFFPPEVLKKVIPSSKVVETNDYNQHSYTPEKHDAFSLGITLLQLKCGTLETGSLNILNEMAKVEKESIRLSENVYRNPFVKISIPDDPNADAIDNRIVHELNGETLDEVIAKLLVRDPEQRITPEDALRLPYFSSQNSQQELRMNNAK